MLSDDDHTLVMGVLNVTPDSFSDGGRFFDHAAAIAHGRAMADAGADIVDVGGESTRPGSRAVPEAEELERVVPVISELAGSGIVVSIDTSKPAVAEAALDAGAAIVNDVTAFGHPDMAPLVAGRGAGAVLMHMLGEPRSMQDDPRYDDVVTDVSGFLEAAAKRVMAAGVARESICLDPGIGFGKTLDHNLALLSSGVPRIAAAGFPVLVGASRKRFIAGVLGSIDPEDRDAPTAVAHALAIAGGASVIRAHNVVMALRTARMADAIVRSSS